VSVLRPHPGQHQGAAEAAAGWMDGCLMDGWMDGCCDGWIQGSVVLLYFSLDCLQLPSVHRFTTVAVQCWFCGIHSARARESARPVHGGGGGGRARGRRRQLQLPWEFSAFQRVKKQTINVGAGSPGRILLLAHDLDLGFYFCIFKEAFVIVFSLLDGGGFRMPAML